MLSLYRVWNYVLTLYQCLVAIPSHKQFLVMLVIIRFFKIKPNLAKVSKCVKSLEFECLIPQQK